MSDSATNGQPVDGQELSAAMNEGAVRPPLPPGAQLAARRAELNITVEQVASQLNLAPRQVHAIEQDNYAALPGMAIVRGFIRSYAKLVKIDPVPLLALIAAETTSAEEGMPLRRPLQAQPFIEGRIAGMHRRRSPWVAIALGLIVLSLIGVAIADRAGLIAISPWKVSHQINSGVSALSRSVDASSASTSGGTSSTELPNNGGVLSGSSQGTPGSSTSGSAMAPGDAAGTGSPSAPVAPSSAASASAPANVPAAAPERLKADVATSGGTSREALTLQLAEDSWVQLKQPDGNVILSQVFKAGSSESIPVTGPVVLTIGNAKGVKASFRGAQLDLPRQTTSNVARLDLK